MTPPQTQRFARLFLAASLTALLGACGGGKDGQATQTAAKVNKEEITVHQINFVLQRTPGLKADQVDTVSRQVLERLIEQELAVQRAEEQKLDRDPRVMQQLEAGRREILARAYAEKMSETAAKPTGEELLKYYNDNPALFAERRIYNVQELAIEARPEQVEGLRAQLQAAKTLTDFIEFLKAKEFRFAGNQAVRAAEQLPLPMLPALAQLKDGQSLVTATPSGLTVLVLAGSRSQPVALDQARPSIEAFLFNQRKVEMMARHLKELRDGARIEYLGKFAEKPAAAASSVAPAGPAAASAPASVASGLDADSISKGLGIK